MPLNFRPGKLNKNKNMFTLYLFSYSDNLNFLAIPFDFRSGKLNKNKKLFTLYLLSYLDNLNFLAIALLFTY